MKMLLLPLVISAMAISYSWSHDQTKSQEASAKPQVTVTYEKKSIDDIISDSNDSELVKLSGEIIQKLKCSTYLFRDDSGEIHIQIDDVDIPRKGLFFNSPVSIKGEVDKNSNRPVRVEAEKVLYLF